MSSSTAPGAVRIYEAVLESMPPRSADRLGSAVFPKVAEDLFSAIFGVPSLFALKSVSPVTGQPMVRWDCVKLAKAASAFWRVARVSRAVFDED